MIILILLKIVQLATFKSTNKSSVVLNDLLNNTVNFTTANRTYGVKNKWYPNQWQNCH